MNKDDLLEMKIKIKCPWPDYNGNDIYEGDIIMHDSGQVGIIKYHPDREHVTDRWVVLYDMYEGNNPESRLHEQINDKGRAVKYKFIPDPNYKEPKQTKPSIKDIPKEDGYYWIYRENCSPTIIYFRACSAEIAWIGSDEAEYFEDISYTKLVGPIQIPK